MNVQLRSDMPSSHRSGGIGAGLGARTVIALMLLSMVISLALCISPSPFFAASPIRMPSLQAVASLPAPHDSLRLMTFNIRHAKGLDGQIRLDAISRQIVQGQADIVALQEVDRFQWRSGLQDQVQALARSLGMHYAFAPALTQGAAEYGVALLSRYPLQQMHIDKLPGGKERRVALTAEAVTPEGVITVITTHLGVPREDRERQMPELLHLVASVSVSTPVVVMGDFNMTAGDPLMKALETALHKVSLAHPQATVLHGGEIDHLFTSLPFGGTKAWTQSSAASDHVPVFAALPFP